MRFRWGFLSICVLAAALAPATAQAAATTYCVTAPGCVGSSQGSLQLALAAASLNPGHDTIKLGPGPYSGPFNNDPLDADGVDIVGAGRTTNLTAATSGVTVLELSGPSTVSNLAINTPVGASDTIGISMKSKGTLEVVDVVVTTPGTGARAIDSQAGDLIVRSSSLVAPTGILPSPSESLTISGVSIAGNVGIHSTGAHVSVENALILLAGASGRGILVDGTPAAALYDGSVEGRNLTIIGDGSAGSAGVELAAKAGVNPTNSDVAISSSVIRGVGVSFRRKGETLSNGGGSAKLKVIYSLFGAVLDQSGPPGPADTAAGNVPGNPDPLFTSPAMGDFTPLSTSPLFNAADPRPLLPGESTVDIIGRPREALGRRDIGAFELQRLPVADKKGPKLKILTGSARLTNKGELKVRLSCPRTETEACEGTVKATSAKKLKLTTRGRKKTLTLGSKGFSIRAGKSKVVVIKVGRTARAQIKKRKRLSVKIAVSATDAAGNVGRVSRTITVRPAKPGKKKK